MSGFERNEVSNVAVGGTELMRNLLEERLSPELLSNFQIIMSRPRSFEEDKIRIIQCHDLPGDPESAKFREKSFLDKFHKLVFISNWQQQNYQLFHNIPKDLKSTVIETGIVPAAETCFNKETDKIRIVYNTTPHRGLELLLPVFEHLAKDDPNIHLDVFSSFKIYGWVERDKAYEPLYDKIRNHPQMTYHGFKPNNEVKEFMNKCHIWAYPSVWVETSCRAMIEAMSAGLVCVHPNYGALPDSSGGLNVMYQFVENPNDHCNVFASNLNAAIQLVKKQKHNDMIQFNKIYVDNRFNIDMIAKKWERMLSELLANYPTIESRAIPKEQFVYRT